MSRTWLDMFLNMHRRALSSPITHRGRDGLRVCKASERPEFARLLDRMESGDILVVSKLDRLGRNAMDLRLTVEKLAGANVKVHYLALGVLT